MYLSSTYLPKYSYSLERLKYLSELCVHLELGGLLQSDSFCDSCLLHVLCIRHRFCLKLLCELFYFDLLLYRLN